MSNLDAAIASQNHFISGNMEAFLGGMAPDCEWSSPEGSLIPGLFRTPEGILNEFFLVLADLADMEMEVLDNTPCGEDEVITRCAYTLTHRQTGKKITLPAINVSKWRDGKMVKFTDLFDTHVARSIAE